MVIKTLIKLQIFNHTMYCIGTIVNHTNSYSEFVVCNVIDMELVEKISNLRSSWWKKKKLIWVSRLIIFSILYPFLKTTVRSLRQWDPRKQFYLILDQIGVNQILTISSWNFVPFSHSNQPTTGEGFFTKLNQ